MATKTDRIIKFTYNSNTYTATSEIANEQINTIEQATFRRTIDGSNYKFITGSTIEWVYSFTTPILKAMFDFFNNAFVASATYDIVFQFEGDDGTFTSYNVLLEQPVYNNELMGDGDNSDTLISYRDFSIRIVQK